MTADCWGGPEKEQIWLPWEWHIFGHVFHEERSGSSYSYFQPYTGVAIYTSYLYVPIPPPTTRGKTNLLWAPSSSHFTTRKIRSRLLMILKENVSFSFFHLACRFAFPVKLVKRIKTGTENLGWFCMFCTRMPIRTLVYLKIYSWFAPSQKI